MSCDGQMACPGCIPASPPVIAATVVIIDAWSGLGSNIANSYIHQGPLNTLTSLGFTILAEILPPGGAVWPALFVPPSHPPLCQLKCTSNSCRPWMNDEILMFKRRNTIQQKTHLSTSGLGIFKFYKHLKITAGNICSSYASNGTTLREGSQN